MAPFAAYTMSGRPGIGSMSSTVWPQSRYCRYSTSHCATARAVSVCFVTSIHGLIS